MATRAARGFGQYSGVARAIERVGERWALLIVRDLLAGARRYSDLKAGLPRIPTNILSDRLKELQEAGVIRRVPMVRGGYELTALGRALEPVVLELERWGWATLGAPADGELLTADALAVALRAAFQADASRPLPRTEYVLHVGDVSVSAMVDAGRLDVIPVGPGALPQPKRRLDGAAAPADLLELTVDTARFMTMFDPASTAVGVLVGGDDLLARFRRTFRVQPDGGSDSVGAADETSVA